MVSRLEKMQTEPVAEGIENDRGNESAKHVDEVVGLDVDGGAAEEEIEGQSHVEETVAVAPKEYHQDGAHAYMRRRESGRGTLAGGLGGFHKVVEEAVGTGRGCQFGMVAEIVTKVREVACLNGIEAYSLEVVLRSCYGKEQIDEIIEEKRGQHNEGGLFEESFSSEQGCQHGKGDEGIVGKVAHMEEFAPYFLRQKSRKFYGGLTAEEGSVGRGEDVVEVREQLAELVGIWIPIAQEGEGEEVTQEERELIRLTSVDEIDDAHTHKHKGAPFEQTERIAHALPENAD